MLQFCAISENWPNGPSASLRPSASALYRGPASQRRPAAGARAALPGVPGGNLGLGWDSSNPPGPNVARAFTAVHRDRRLSAQIGRTKNGLLFIESVLLLSSLHSHTLLFIGAGEAWFLGSPALAPVCYSAATVWEPEPAGARPNGLLMLCAFGEATRGGKFPVSKSQAVFFMLNFPIQTISCQFT